MDFILKPVNFLLEQTCIASVDPLYFLNAIQNADCVGIESTMPGELL